MDTRYKELLLLPVVRTAPFLAAGTLFAYFLPTEIFWAVFSASAAAAIFFAIRKSKLFICLAGFLAGAVLMTLHVSFYSNPILCYAGQDIRAEVYVSEILTDRGSSIDFIGKISLDGKTANVRLTSDPDFDEGCTIDADISLDIADERYLTQNLAKGVLLSGDVAEIHEIKRGKTGIASVMRAMRNGFKGTLSQNVSGDEGLIARAILFGDDDALPASLSEQIKISGLSHYTAVSGAHFAIFAAVILEYVSAKNKRKKGVLMILTAAAALLFFGATASVIRAAAMFIISGAAFFLRRKPETLNSLCLAVTIILIISPASVLDIGFDMSVLGVFGAGVLGPKISEKLCEYIPERLRLINPLITAFAVSLGALVCTAPISAAVFKGVSLCAVLTSVIIMPLMSVGMIFMLLLGATNAGFLAVPIDLAMKLVLYVVRFFGNIRGMYLCLDFGGAWILAAICAVLLTLAAFCRIKFLKHCFGGVAVLSLASVIISLCTVNSRREIRFVGNSKTSAAIALCGNEAAVYIAGNGSGLADDISRCMRERGAVKINVLAAFEADFGGALTLNELCEMIKTEKLYASEAACKILNFPAEQRSENTEFRINGARIASAQTGDESAQADMILYHGGGRKTPCNAGLGVFFVNTALKLPENAVNIKQKRDYRVTFPNEDMIITIGE